MVKVKFTVTIIERVYDYFTISPPDINASYSESG